MLPDPDSQRTTHTLEKRALESCRGGRTPVAKPGGPGRGPGGMQNGLLHGEAENRR